MSTGCSGPLAAQGRWLIWAASCSGPLAALWAAGSSGPLAALGRWLLSGPLAALWASGCSGPLAAQGRLGECEERRHERMPSHTAAPFIPPAGHSSANNQRKTWQPEWMP